MVFKDLFGLHISAVRVNIIMAHVGLSGLVPGRHKNTMQTTPTTLENFGVIVKPLEPTSPFGTSTFGVTASQAPIIALTTFMNLTVCLFLETFDCSCEKQEKTRKKKKEPPTVKRETRTNKQI